MKVLSLTPFVRSGHFFWCVAERTVGHRECQYCRFQLYAGALLVSLVIAGIEFWGSRYTQSASLWSDAWHVASDGLGYGIGGSYAFLVSRRILSKGGQVRFKRWCEFFLGMLLVLSGCMLLVDALGDLWQSRIPTIIEQGVLLGVAILGLLTNGVLLLLFHAFGAGHAHAGHSHNGDKLLQGNFWHTFGDTASSGLVVMNASIVSWSPYLVSGYVDLTVSAVIASILLWQGIAIFAEENTNPQ